jgi:hypothetical protein
VGLKSNGTNQLLVYADVNLLDYSMQVRRLVQKYMAEETKYTMLSCHQNAGQNHGKDI